MLITVIRRLLSPQLKQPPNRIRPLWLAGWPYVTAALLIGPFLPCGVSRDPGNIETVSICLQCLAGRRNLLPSFGIPFPWTLETVLPYPVFAANLKPSFIKSSFSASLVPHPSPKLTNSDSAGQLPTLCALQIHLLAYLLNDGKWG